MPCPFRLILLLLPLTQAEVRQQEARRTHDADRAAHAIKEGQAQLQEAMAQQRSLSEKVDRLEATNHEKQIENEKLKRDLIKVREDGHASLQQVLGVVRTKMATRQHGSSAYGQGSTLGGSGLRHSMPSAATEGSPGPAPGARDDDDAKAGD